jgi:hypothetical protein
LAAKVAALEKAREFLPPAQVEGASFGRQFPVIVDAHGYTIGGELGESLRPDFELHVHARIVAEGGVF